MEVVSADAATARLRLDLAEGAGGVNLAIPKIARAPVEGGELMLIVAQHVFDYFAASIPASLRNDQKGFGPSHM